MEDAVRLKEAHELPRPALPKGEHGVFTWQEIAPHCTRESCYLVADGRVFDVTAWLDHHPAGSACLLKHAGAQDSTVDFKFHSASARASWSHFQIGFLEGHEPRACVIL